MLITGGEFYAAIAVLNSVLLIFSIDASDFFLWFVLFETSIVTALSTLTVEGRSVRRIWALLSMLLMAFLGSVATISAFTVSQRSPDGGFSESSVATKWALIAIGSLAVMVKLPLFPGSFGLPEAHVEASWPGSVALAGYALKFATVSLITFFGTNFLMTCDIMGVVALISMVFGMISLGASNDSKKLVANLSIVHMSATFLLLVSVIAGYGVFAIDFSGHHHSISTGILFVLIGIVYASTGSRLFRFLLGNPIQMPVFGTLWFALFTFSLDLPWTANVVVELGVFVVAISSAIGIFSSLVLLLWLVIIAVLITGFRGNGNSGKIASDLPTFWCTLAIVAAVGVVTIGFCTAECNISSGFSFLADGGFKISEADHQISSLECRQSGSGTRKYHKVILKFQSGRIFFDASLKLGVSEVIFFEYFGRCR